MSGPVLVLIASAAIAEAQTAVRATVPVTELEARNAIVSAIRTRMGQDAEVRIETIRLGGAPPVAAGALTAAPEPGARLGRPIRFSLARKAMAGPGRGVPAGYAVATVFVDLPHTRAARPISRGETCTADDFIMSRAEVGAVRLQHLPAASDIVGARAIRDIAADEVITRSLVLAGTAVKSGDLVRLQAGEDGVTVETEGVATQSGDAGETIRVVNRESRRTVRARVIGPGRVEVVQ